MYPFNLLPQEKNIRQKFPLLLFFSYTVWQTDIWMSVALVSLHHYAADVSTLMAEGTAQLCICIKYFLHFAKKHVTVRWQAVFC